MKPLVLIVQQHESGKVLLTEQELKNIIEEAYKSGVNDANNHGLLTPCTPTGEFFVSVNNNGTPV